MILRIFRLAGGGFGLRECSEEGELYPMALDGGAKV